MAVVSGLTDLLLREMLSPKNVHIPRDIVREQMRVTMAAIPRPTLLFTRSILPNREGGRREEGREGGRERKGGFEGEGTTLSGGTLEADQQRRRYRGRR